MRLRQKEGLSYGAGSFLNCQQRRGIRLVRRLRDLRAAKPRQTAGRLPRGAGRALKDGFTEQEIAEAKTGILQSSQLRRAQDGSLAGTLAAYQRLGRDMKFVADFEAKLKALTPEQVLTAMRKNIDPPSSASPTPAISPRVRQNRLLSDKAASAIRLNSGNGLYVLLCTSADIKSWEKQATILVACFALGLRYVISIVPYWPRFLRRTKLSQLRPHPPADRGFVLRCTFCNFQHRDSLHRIASA